MTYRKNPFIRQFAATLAVVLSAGSLSAQDVYSWHFNLDENLPGADEPILDTGWDFYYGASGTLGHGDPNLVSGNSEGSTGGVKFNTDFENNDRGFMFASGASGFAPGGFLFTSTDLATTDSLLGQKASGTVQDMWNAPTGATAFSSKTIGDLISMNAVVLPRNSTISYHFAFQANGNWYVDPVGTTGVTSWSAYNWSLSGADVVELPFAPGVSMDLDLTDNPPIPIASLSQGATVTGYGMFVDTDALVGTSDSWARMDAYVVEAVPEPSTYAAITGLIALVVLLVRRRRK